ncbi:hypothetical protein F5051DRAFT_247329 [Lentinula edodes]|nr:hypothetical protein F5051DRAFT_247329 [Lentinula edodes]
MPYIDAPPRLPSPVYDSSLTLSTAIPVSDIPLNIDNTDNANDVNETPMGQGRYVSFRERLNTAVGLLEADDVSSFRERLTSALDAVRTDERETDIESSNLPGSSRNTQQYNDRALQAPSGPSGSRPWRTLVLNNMRNGADETANLSPRTRDIFNSPSPSPDPTTLSNSESRMRPLYLASHSVLSQSRDSFSRSVSPSGLGDTSTGPLTGERQIRYNSTEHSSRASEPMPTIRSHQHPSPQRSTGLAFPRRPPSQSIEQLSSASVSAPFNRELARWFEVPADTTLPEHPPSSSVAAAARSVTPLPLSDTDDEWINLGSRAQSRVERLREAIPGRGFAFPRTNRYLDRGEDDDQDQEDEDIIAGLLSSTYERANHASTTSATRINTSSRSTRVPPSLASLMARDHLFSDQDDHQDDDNVTVRASDSTEASRTERYRDSSAPRRYTDVLSIADYRSQLLADAQRRRYIEQGSVNPRESLESWTSSNQEHRRSTTNNASNFDQDERSSAGYRLTAHTEDERSSLASVRWQFSWNDALGLDQSELRQDEARAFQRERGRLDGRSQIPTNVPRSSLFGRSMRDENPLSNNAQNIDESSGVSRWEPRRNEQNINGDLAYQRLRSRVFGSTRSSASNSLVAENAAEIRRRNARADLMEHLFHDDTSRPSNRPLNRDHARNTDSWRSSVIGHRESFPSQRSIPYQRRSPSPSDFPRSIADVLDATDQELEEQERRTREEGADVLPRRSNSLSWLPPPQFGFDQSLSETLVGFSSDLNTANSSEGGRLPEIDWLRRRSLAMSRFRHSDDSRAQTHSTPTEFERSNHVTPFSRSRAPSSSSRVAPSSESSGFFDSRHSSITDIARTINDRSNLLSSRAQLLNDSDLETSPRTVPNDAHLRRPLRTYSPRIDAERRNNSAPFIPPPDLGSLFSPNDLSTSSFHSSVSMDIDQESPPARSHQRHAPTQSDPSHIVPSSTARTPYPSINVDSFAPGPFRSTMQRLAAQNNLRNVSQEAPTIPPLSFGEDLESFSEARSYIGAENQENTIGYNLEEPRGSNPSLIRESRMPSFERAPWPSQTPSSIRSRTREPSRTGDDIHGAITRRARMEGSLIEGSIPLSGTLSNTPLGDESFQHAIEVLRQDGLSELRSHQLINRYRQRRDAFPTATSWGDIESDNTQNLSYRYAPWSMHGDVSTSNPAASASSTTSNTTARMGNAATRRRPSPARNLDRPDGSQDSRANRPRISSRFGRHRTSELDRDFATLSDLVGRSRRARGNFNLGDYMVSALFLNLLPMC